MKFIYALNNEDKKLLLAQGFTFITELDMGRGKAFVFENRPTKYATFSNQDKDRFLITDKMHFV